MLTQMQNVLPQTNTEQQWSNGLVLLTSINPGRLQFVIGGFGHTFGLHITVLVDSSQTQFWHLYSKFSLN